MGWENILASFSSISLVLGLVALAQPNYLFDFAQFVIFNFY